MNCFCLKPSGVPDEDELDLICLTLGPCLQQREEDTKTVILDDDDVDFLEMTETNYGRNRYDSLDETLSSERDEESSSNVPTFVDSFERTVRLASEEDTSNTQDMVASHRLDEDLEDKPLRRSRRGAKHVLLWKFLLQTLDQRPDLATWVDVKKGIFKFVDTTALSMMWGERKQRRDMNFEKLSRGIRHYYKSGLMTRKEGTRLVYQFHWNRVPKEYQK